MTIKNSFYLDTVDLEDSKSLLLDHDEDELLNDDVLNVSLLFLAA